MADFEIYYKDANGNLQKINLVPDLYKRVADLEARVTALENGSGGSTEDTWTRATEDYAITPESSGAYYAYVKITPEFYESDKEPYVIVGGAGDRTIVVTYDKVDLIFLDDTKGETLSYEKIEDTIYKVNVSDLVLASDDYHIYINPSEDLAYFVVGGSSSGGSSGVEFTLDSSVTYTVQVDPESLNEGESCVLATGTDYNLYLVKLTEADKSEINTEANFAVSLDEGIGSIFEYLTNEVEINSNGILYSFYTPSAMDGALTFTTNPSNSRCYLVNIS